LMTRLAASTMDPPLEETIQTSTCNFHTYMPGTKQRDARSIQ
jgi:hypothetical protein